ncbi:NAD(P)-dependent oxidoreductase [Herbiconiux sp. UC225_62]|uniref:NAD(P)-dependent oxidoreductase n=1 Tax=Herbiconiux sp. UC225_62 TaxID=3350168 RepID=UPI0036D366BF
MSDDRVAVLGLGTMGRAFAVNLAATGFAVSGYNRTRCADMEELALPVSTVAATAVAGAGVVIVMLTDAAATTAVLLAPQTLEALEPGAIVVNTATIGVAEVGELARALAAARPDLVFVDAPVSGSKVPAEQGAVTILASSDADDEMLRARLAPVFDAIGRRTVWLGPTGAGSAMKIVVNTWLVHVMQGIAETALLADRLGIDPQAIADTLSGGPLDTPYAAAKLRKIGSGDHSTEMALSLGAKDARLAVEAGAGLDLPVSELIAALWSEAAASGTPLAGQDVSAIYTALHDRSIA